MEKKPIFHLRGHHRPSPAIELEATPDIRTSTGSLRLNPQQVWNLIAGLVAAMRGEFGLLPGLVKNPRWEVSASPDLPGARLLRFEHPVFGKLSFVYPQDELEKLRAELAKPSPFAPGTNTKQ
jgi:hypothetical protein